MWKYRRNFIESFGLNCEIPKSKHRRITSNTGSADLRVFQNSGLLQEGSQTNQGTSKDQMIESQTLSGRTFRVREAEFLRYFETRSFKAAKPRDTFHLSSASLRPYFCDYSRLGYLISTKSPFYLRVYSKIKKNPPIELPYNRD
jgi:hypothetical protein